MAFTAAANVLNYQRELDRFLDSFCGCFQCFSLRMTARKCGNTHNKIAIFIFFNYFRSERAYAALKIFLAEKRRRARIDVRGGRHYFKSSFCHMPVEYGFLSCLSNGWMCDRLAGFMKYKLPTMEELYEARVHIGHQTRRWNPKIAPFIFTKERKIHIIDLEKTLSSLEKACEFLYEIAKKGGVIVFLGSKRQAKEHIQKGAEAAGALYITDRWLGGILTNFDMLKKNSIGKLNELTKNRAEGKFDKLTKKERLLIDREIAKLERSVGGIRSLTKIPDALVIIDIHREKTAVAEAKTVKIPVVASVDTNSNPEDVKFPIPANDDAGKAVGIIVSALAEAVKAGYEDKN